VVAGGGGGDEDGDDDGDDGIMHRTCMTAISLFGSDTESRWTTGG